MHQWRRCERRHHAVCTHLAQQLKQTCLSTKRSAHLTLILSCCLQPWQPCSLLVMLKARCMHANKPFEKSVSISLTFKFHSQTPMNCFQNGSYAVMFIHAASSVHKIKSGTVLKMVGILHQPRSSCHWLWDQRTAKIELFRLTTKIPSCFS